MTSSTGSRRCYKDEVLQLSNSFQRSVKIDLPNRMRGLSDKEIAKRLDLDERTVSEIRCVAERDCYDLDEWERTIQLDDPKKFKKGSLLPACQLAGTLLPC